MFFIEVVGKLPAYFASLPTVVELTLNGVLLTAPRTSEPILPETCACAKASSIVCWTPLPLADASSKDLSAEDEELSAGAEELSAGTEELSAGAEELSAGTEELSAGAEELLQTAPQYLQTAPRRLQTAPQYLQTAPRRPAGTEELSAGTEELTDVICSLVVELAIVAALACNPLCPSADVAIPNNNITITKMDIDFFLIITSAFYAYPRTGGKLNL